MCAGQSGLLNGKVCRTDGFLAGLGPSVPRCSHTLSYSNSESDVSAVGLDPAVDLACMLGLLENLPLDHHLNTADSGQKPAGSGPSVQILRRSSIVPVFNFRRQSPSICLMEEK